MHNQTVKLTTLLSVLALTGCVELDDTDPTVEESFDETASEIAIPACAAGTWCVEPSPATGTLHDIFATGADVFAVGDGGMIMRRSNNEWVQMESGTTANLRAVAGTSATNVWAVGHGGTVLRFDGSAWSPLAVTSSNIDAIWIGSANDIFMSGGSTVWRSNNGGASFTATTLSGTLFSISGVSASEVYVTGENAYVRKWNGSSWSTVNPGAGTATYFSVLALAAGDVWVADFMPSKETMHLVKGKWAAKATSSAIFQGMHKGASVNDLWGVGGTKVGRWNGSSWTMTTPFGASASLWGVSGTSGHIYAVGGNGLVAHYVY